MKRLALILMLCAGAAGAAPETSKRPVGRAGTTASGAMQAAPSGAIVVPQRPVSAISGVESGRATRTSLRPETRPRKIARLARKAEKLRKKGAICGNPDIKGEQVGRVTSAVTGCGISQAVRVRSVSGIALSPAAVMDCTTALTLDAWVITSAVPRLRKTGGGLKGLRVIGHYACRTRNNRPGGRISEHGKGRAIDIAGFRLRDGSQLTVLNDWDSKRGFSPLREMHRDACGIFGTVLGPKSDRFHQDHFHFDTARHRGGSYCR